MADLSEFAKLDREKVIRNRIEADLAHGTVPSAALCRTLAADAPEVVEEVFFGYGWDVLESTVSALSPARPRVIVRADEGRRRSAGSGRRADVYEAMTVVGHRAAALKVFRNEADFDSLKEEVVAATSAVLKRLGRRELVRVLAVGRFEGRPCMVTDLVDGRSLSAVLLAGGLLASATSAGVATVDDEVHARLDLFTALAELLHEAHRAGLAHGALHPGAVMVRRADLRPAVLNLGLSYGDPRGPGAEFVTGARARYRPPETPAGRGSPGERSDRWAVSVMLREAVVEDACLRGAAVFREGRLRRISDAVAAAASPDPSVHCGRVAELLRHATSAR